MLSSMIKETPCITEHELKYQKHVGQPCDKYFCAHSQFNKNASLYFARVESLTFVNIISY